VGTRGYQGETKVNGVRRLKSDWSLIDIRFRGERKKKIIIRGAGGWGGGDNLS